MLYQISRAFFLTLLCFPMPGALQQPQPAEADRSRILEAARELIEKARYCAMVTVGEDGHPQARLVDPFTPEDEFTVWIATNPVTRKVAQVRKDPRVTLVYSDPAGSGYVTLLGKAVLVNDPAEKAKRWKEEWSAFYRDENRGDDYVLIRVRPVRLEIVSYSHQLINDAETWRPVTVEFQ